MRCHLFSFACVDASRSDPNLAKVSSSLNAANSNFNFPEIFFIIPACAAHHTRDTDNHTLIAGFIPALKRSDSRYICPSVIEITLVGIYADTSPACVSMIGKAVNEPHPYFSSSLQALSKSLE